ncbi:MAG: hypothetical protein Q7S11_03570 [bacterium]|nr:hypothetical protein [bacterium]
MNEVAHNTNLDNLTDTKSKSSEEFTPEERELMTGVILNEDEQTRIKDEIARVKEDMSRDKVLGKPTAESEKTLGSLEKELSDRVTIVNSFADTHGYEIITENDSNNNATTMGNNEKIKAVESGENEGNTSHEGRQAHLESSIDQTKQEIAELQKNKNSSYVIQEKLKFLNYKLTGLEGELEIVNKSLHQPDKDTVESKMIHPKIFYHEPTVPPVPSVESIEASNKPDTPPGEKSVDEINSLVYQTPEGVVLPMRNLAKIKQEARAPVDERPAVNEELGRSLLYDETIVGINREIDAENRKAKEASARLSDHAGEGTPSDLEKSIRRAKERVRELEIERTLHIKNKITSSSNEDVGAMTHVAKMVIANPNEKHKIEALEVIKALQEKDSHANNEMPGSDEATEIVPEVIVPSAAINQEVPPKELALKDKPISVVSEIVQTVEIPLIKNEEALVPDTASPMKTISEQSTEGENKKLTPVGEKPPEDIKEMPRVPFVLTTEAQELLKSVESRAFPAFVSVNLKKIMGENGIEVSENDTPNALIEKLKQKQQESLQVNEQGEKELNPFEKAILKIKSEDPARAERLLATIGTNQEQRERIEKLLSATQTFTENTEAIEKDSQVVEYALKIGNAYRNLPLKKKLIASALLVGGASAFAATGGASAAMIATAALTGSAFQRAMGGLAMFAAVEGMLTKKSIASNEKEERMLGMRMNVILGALAGTGVFLGGKLLGDYLSTPTESGAGSTSREVIANQLKVPPPIPESTSSISTSEIPASPPHEVVENSMHPTQNEYVQKVEAVRESIKSEATQTVPLVETSYTVHGDDKLWNIIKEKIPEIQDLDGEGRQSNAIANIIEQIKKDPGSFGISSGNVDSLSAGDTIHLDKIHDVLNTTTIPIEDGQSVGIIERASGLTDTESSHIITNNEKISAWHAVHPDALLTTETVEKILSGTMDGATSVTPEINHLAEITKDYTLSMPDTGGRTMEQLAAEALAMDTNAVLHADVQTMFGSKGFFGYGFLGTNGEKSIDWLDFKDRPVSEVVTKSFGGTLVGDEGGVQKFGMDSPGAIDKMKGYLKMLTEKAGSGITPEPKETVEHFSKRAIGVIISKK